MPRWKTTRPTRSPASVCRSAKAADHGGGGAARRPAAWRVLNAHADLPTHDGVCKPKKQRLAAKRVLSAEERAYAPLKSVREQQRSTQLLLKYAPIARIVAQLLDACKPGEGYRINKSGRMALCEAAQDFIVQLFQLVNRLAIHAGRVTVMMKDMECLYDLEKTNHGYHADAPVGGYAADMLRCGAEKIVGYCPDSVAS